MEDFFVLNLPRGIWERSPTVGGAVGRGRAGGERGPSAVAAGHTGSRGAPGPPGGGGGNDAALGQLKCQERYFDD